MVIFTSSLLLEEIVITCEIEGVHAILNAAKRRFDESQQERAKGSADWWRPQQQQPDGLVAGSLDLLTMLLKNAPTDVVKAVYEVCYDPVVRTVLQSDDHGEMQERKKKFLDIPHESIKELGGTDLKKILGSYKEGKVGYGVGHDIESSVVQAIYDCPFLGSVIG